MTAEDCYLFEIAVANMLNVLILTDYWRCNEMNILIYREETYPENLRKLCFELEKIDLKEKDILMRHEDVFEFLQGIYEDAKPFPFLVELEQEIVRNMEPHNITVYQNTRLTSRDDVLEQGLRFPDKQYEKHLVDQMIVNSVDRDILDEVLEQLAIYKNNMHESRCRNIFFYYDLDAQYDYQDFFKCFGGELIARATGYDRVNDDCEVRFRKIVELGMPYRVQFRIPFSWFNWKQYRCSEDRFDIARLMLAYWIDSLIKGRAHDRRKDGRIGFEIPPENIDLVELVDLDLLSPPQYD